MNEKFYEQKKEKQDLMINGAMEVFAKNGYKHASTDDMVKVCGVSKGLWFHYFDNKLGLYSFIAQYGIQYVLLEYGIRIDKEVTDYYELIYKEEETKVALMEKYPYLPLLIISLFEETDEEAVRTIKDALESYRDRLRELMLQGNYGRFKEDIEIVKLDKMVKIFFNDLMKLYYRDNMFRKEAYLEEVKGYLDMLTSITYQ